MIPKIIHQTYATSELPPDLAANVAHLRAMNAGWDYRLYDDTDIPMFIARHYGDKVLASYRRINPRYGATRADLFRYLLLYQCGGVYLDIKSSVVRPLDSVLLPGDDCVLAHWPNRPLEPYKGWGRHAELRGMPRGEYQQWHVIMAPRHPVLRAVIQACLANIALYEPRLHGVGKKGALRLTGPIAYSLAVAQVLAAHRHRVADTHEELGLRYSIYDERGQQAHKALFARHYSTLTEPIVLPPHAPALAESRRPVP